MADTMHLSKEELIARAQADMERKLDAPEWTLRQKLALTCRILFDGGHDSGLAGQITARAPEAGRYYTQRLGLGFDEITADNLLVVDEDLRVQEGGGMPNPANRFHSWIYRARPDVNCIIHTHPLHAASLSMLEVPLEISHMDNCPLYGDVAFLKDWPGVPVGNEEGEIISAALGDKRAILLSHHGMLVAAASVEKPACWRCSSSARAHAAAGDGGRQDPADPAGAGARGARLDPDAAPLAGGFRLLRAAGAQDASRRVGLRLAALQGGGACVSPPGSASGRRRPLVRSGRGARRTGAFRACLPVVFRSTPAHDRPASPIADPAPPASLSLEQLAQRTGLTKSYLSKLEEG